MHLRSLLWICLLTCLTVTVFAQSPKPGELQPHVSVQEDSSYSYALYLPSAYTPQKRWPILLAFDPAGHGSAPVKLFQQAAEKYGFIVAGSNNARNFSDPSTAIRLLWADVTRQFAIDPQRIYVTGHSGGARVASSIAIACKTCIAGIIANCAGLPPESRTLPESSEWFLVTGTTDFNYPEMLRLHENLEAHKKVSRFEVFSGRHGWMPPEMAEEALAWMQLRAMVKGIMPANPEWIKAEFQRQASHAQDLKARGDVLAASRAEQNILRDFKPLLEKNSTAVATMEKEAGELSASSALKKAIKNEKAGMDLQVRVEEQLTNALTAVRDSNGDRESFNQLHSVAESALSDAKSAGDTERRNAIDRGIWSAFVFAIETGQSSELSKNYPMAKDMYQAAATIRPETAGPHSALASAYAATGDKKHAIEELRKAVDKGLSNPEAFADKDFDRLRDDPAFQELLARVNAKTQSKQN